MSLRVKADFYNNVNFTGVRLTDLEDIRALRVPEFL